MRDFPYSAPLIGVSLGPLLGGALTQGLSWRATFYFIAIFTGICVLAFLAFEDTFRRERSAVYVAAAARRRRGAGDGAVQDVRLSLRDVNALGPMLLVLRRGNNVAILTASGLIFGFSYCISYTCSRVLAAKYGYDALKIGLVLLAYGIGKSSFPVFLGRARRLFWIWADM